MSKEDTHYKVGDTVRWTDPDDGVCTRQGVLTAVRYLGPDALRITMGEWVAEVLESELTLLKCGPTPGKWKLHDPGPGPYAPLGEHRVMVLHPDGERLIACCTTGHAAKYRLPYAERLANAKLIAQAPKMLDALKRAKAEIESLRRNTKEAAAGPSAVVVEIEEIIIATQ